ncbi:MAG: hypothetical protein U5K81_08720 [Trueperaceae bacterium]|nr:hypothetical protein [Trueperaceae bacterium]
MNERPPSDHRLRYQHLADRRRLGFELARLWTRMTRHPDWPQRPLAEREALRQELDVPLAPALADARHLEADVRTLTARLVRLAKALRALDTGDALPVPD